MAELRDLDPVDGNNNQPPSEAGWPEGTMNYADVNDAGRALDGMLAREYLDTNGSLTSTGSGGNYLLALNRTLASLVRGDKFAFEANHTNPGPATLDVSSLGARDIVKSDATPLAAGDMASGSLYFVVYDGSVFELLSWTPPSGAITVDDLTVNDSGQIYKIGETAPTLADADTAEVVLGTKTGDHIEFGGRFIQAKSNATTASGLFLQNLGGQVFGPAGTEAAPGYAFGADADLGIFRATANQIGVSTAGAQILRFAPQGIAIQDGTEAAPAYYFLADTDTGFYRAGNNTIGIATGGVRGGRFVGPQFRSEAGSAAVPGIGINDDNTGFFSPANNQIGVANAGIHSATFGSNFMSVQNTSQALFQLRSGAALDQAGDISVDSGGIFELEHGAGGRIRLRGNGYLLLDAREEGLVPQIGFLGAGPKGIQSVVGSRDGNTALAALISAMAQFGLVVDNSTP